ncbi:hypothetical protein Fmac_022403 [Flemingia macrophylla]|uniref:Uncharacterized protein n=1 Tax=Flemingia macrophylla TaxID=520843 RepID=A0ABD1LZL9_9FABA
MAVTKTNTKCSLHLRSNSLPSTPHPFTSEFEEYLQRLKDSEATSSLTTSSINYKLDGLQYLHECADKLLQLSITQQALARECRNKCIDELLDGSVRILDICDTIKDCLVQEKESMNWSQLFAGKEMLKLGFKNELIVASSNKDNETLSMLSILEESEIVTMSSLESFLLFITGSKGQSKQNRWSIISKLMQPTRVGCKSQEADTNEFEKVDAALMSLINHKPSSIDNFRRHLKNLEICIQNLEAGVEFLSRQLIRTRVADSSADSKGDRRPLGGKRVLREFPRQAAQPSLESMYELESVIRRIGTETRFTIEGGKYLASKKNMKKAIRKALVNLKGISKNEQIVTSLYKDNESLTMLSILKEAEVVTVSSLESMLLFVTGLKGTTKAQADLPSSPHPLVSQFQDHVQRLKDSEATRTSLKSSSISQTRIGLQDLHDYADKLLQLPTTQQAFVLECSFKLVLVDVLLEGSPGLLDICSIVHDCLLQSKESIHMIKSIIRRKGADTEFVIEDGKYLASRKKMKKEIQKALGNLKGIKNE